MVVLVPFDVTAAALMSAPEIVTVAPWGTDRV